MLISTRHHLLIITLSQFFSKIFFSYCRKERVERRPGVDQDAEQEPQENWTVPDHSRKGEPEGCRGEQKEQEEDHQDRDQEPEAWHWGSEETVQRRGIFYIQS